MSSDLVTEPQNSSLAVLTAAQLALVQLTPRQLNARQRNFQQLARAAANCQLCPRLANRNAILSAANGTLQPLVMFIAEAPGRLGADRTGIPLSGDLSGRNFEQLLAGTGLRRDQIFISNAVLCNPRNQQGNLRPNAQEINNCQSFLRQQLALLAPPIVVTLGAVALNAINQVAEHGLTLTAVGGVYDWFNRKLIPLYHPSPHVVNRLRRLSQQQQDYQLINHTLAALTKLQR